MLVHRWSAILAQNQGKLQQQYRWVVVSVNPVWTDLSQVTQLCYLRSLTEPYKTSMLRYFPYCESNDNTFGV